MMIVLSAMILVVEGVRHHEPEEAALLLALLALTRLLRRLAAARLPRAPGTLP